MLALPADTHLRRGGSSKLARPWLAGAERVPLPARAATTELSARARAAGLRDTIYKVVARNRITIFGGTDTCRRATKEDKKHFL